MNVWCTLAVSLTFTGLAIDMLFPSASGVHLDYVWFMGEEDRSVSRI